MVTNSIGSSSCNCPVTTAGVLHQPNCPLWQPPGSSFYLDTRGNARTFLCGCTYPESYRACPTHGKEDES